MHLRGAFDGSLFLHNDLKTHSVHALMTSGCMQLAVEQVNANEMKLLQGSRLTYLLNNTEDTTEGSAVAQWLVQQNVVALYGGTHTRPKCHIIYQDCQQAREPDQRWKLLLY